MLQKNLKIVRKSLWKMYNVPKNCDNFILNLWQFYPQKVFLCQFILLNCLRNNTKSYKIKFQYRLDQTPSPLYNVKNRRFGLGRLPILCHILGCLQSPTVKHGNQDTLTLIITLWKHLKRSHTEIGTKCLIVSKHLVPREKSSEQKLSNIHNTHTTHSDMGDLPTCASWAVF